MHQYLESLKNILKTGSVRENRTGIDTKGLNFNDMEFNLNFGQNFPILTTKRVAYKAILGELLGFMRGTNSAADFRALDCNVWNANANEKGFDDAHPNHWLSNPTRKGTDDLGRIYGVQWRFWEDTKIRESNEQANEYYRQQGYDEVAQFMPDTTGPMLKVWSRKIDQIKKVIDTLSVNPTDRRSIITGWNPGDLNEMALPPCHLLQHYLCEKLTTEERLEAHIVKYESIAVWEKNTTEGIRDKIKKDFNDMKGTDEEKLDKLEAPKYKLDLIMYQRSADSILGVPFNISSYGMMLQIMARMTGHAPGTLHYLTGDTHIYENHFNAANEQINRKPLVSNARFIINPTLRTLGDFERASQKDFRIFNYQNLGKLNHETPMAV